ncbi:hypothetical protein CAEBREN_20754 [Caenorhabditis brenneri]|uniref:Uncharacterized protein n=1 Tax=Caenorhabditis brenneri TaxID=135651 RepID=G0PIT9_CAEBE|nr:hypothetical protein CAEBREN_20754 [Caenorhabditis brenneri]
MCTNEKKKVPEDRHIVPFELDITPPPPLRIPAEGFLEVKIENNTTTTQIVGVTFDSFFFELVGDGFNSEKGNAGGSLSAIMGYERLPSGGSVTLKIGFGGEDIMLWKNCNGYEEIEEAEKDFEDICSSSLVATERTPSRRSSIPILQTTPAILCYIS